jgi:hypothetical protein
LVLRRDVGQRQDSYVDRIKEWVALIGRRNVAYVLFVSLLVPFGMAIEAAGPKGPDSGGGIMAAIMLWSVVSLIFFIANAGLAIGRQRPVGYEALDRVCSADCLYSPPLGLGAVLRTMTVFLEGTN